MSDKVGVTNVGYGEGGAIIDFDLVVPAVGCCGEIEMRKVRGEMVGSSSVRVPALIRRGERTGVISSEGTMGSL